MIDELVQFNNVKHVTSYSEIVNYKQNLPFFWECIRYVLRFNNSFLRDLLRN